MPFLVRPCEQNDLPTICAIYGHAVVHGTASFELDPPHLGEMERRRAALLDAGFPYLVAEEEGAVLGYAYAGHYRLRPAYRWSVEDSVYVAPGEQGRGIGRTLLARLIEECESRGLRQMVAVIGDDASSASIRLHGALGFRQVGRLEAVGFKHGRWCDSVLMQRALGVGAGAPPGERP